MLAYIPGDTLAERMDRGPIPLKEALSLSRQVAAACAFAHEHGIVHRDLKPGNIKVNKEGRVKVPDFGIAKAVGGESPDAYTTVTKAGQMIGTPAYMSPEQVRGEPADQRVDIWSFGCLLYEMLSGKAPFAAETTSDTLANILQAEPDWRALPEGTPPNIRSLLRCCLIKDPHRRLRDIGDAAITIRETVVDFDGGGPTAVTSEGSARTSGLRRMLTWTVPCVLLGAVAAAIVTWHIKRPAAVPLPVSRFPVSLPRNQMLMPEIAVSPDGKRLVYRAFVSGARRLYLQESGQLAARELQGTEGAHHPFFSPDGKSIGFGDDGKLMILSLDGGTPVPRCEISYLLGGCWGPDGMIYLSPSGTSGIWKISADGGEPERLTTPAEGEFSHQWPEILPGGEAILFSIWRTDLNDFSIAVLSLSTGQWKTLLPRASHGRYAPTGHLLYGQGGALWAAPFDVKQLEVGHPRHPVVDAIDQSIYNGCAPFCFSNDGTLYYIKGGHWLARRQLAWVNRSGEVEELLLDPGAYMHPRLSPDEQRLAFTMFKDGIQQIWIYDFPGSPPTQLTFEGHNFLPLWMPPNGDRLTFSSWAPDGKTLLFDESSQESSGDVGVLSIEDDEPPQLLLHEAWDEDNAVFSPDGNWIAYHSDREDLEEVYVISYPELASQTKVSSGGGRNPLWSRDGKELFYRVGNKMMAASIETEPKFKVTGTEVLFDGRLLATDIWGHNYDVSGDAQRFLMVKENEEQPAASQLVVVLNWFEELKKLVPTGKD